jgi:hypothetical protein
MVDRLHPVPSVNNIPKYAATARLPCLVPEAFFIAEIPLIKHHLVLDNTEPAADLPFEGQRWAIARASIVRCAVGATC